MLTENPTQTSKKTVFINGKPFFIVEADGKPKLRRFTVTEESKI
jgi:hypothetical protein